MSATAEARRLTRQHVDAQALLAASVLAQMRRLWLLLDPDDLDLSTHRWMRASLRLILAQHEASAITAGNYMAAFRAAEGITGRFTLSALPELPYRAVITSLRVTGPVTVKQSLRRGAPILDAMAAGEARSAGAAERHVLNGGRDRIYETGVQDPVAVGFYRVTRGNPCAFCALMASRGPIYMSRRSARLDRPQALKPHDSCHCTVEPIYRRDSKWPDDSRRYAEVYEQAKAEDGSTKSNFRRLIEAS